MEPHALKSKSKKKISSNKVSRKKISQRRAETKEKIEYIVVSFDIMAVEGEDTIFVRLKNIKTKLYLIRTPKEIILNYAVAFGLSKKELIQVSYIAGYEHNARGACTIDGDDEKNENQ